MIKVDKKIKNMKKAPSAKLGTSKYPFAKMEVNNSFIVDEGKRYSVSTLAHRFAQSQDPTWEFEVKTVLEDGNRILRCIRIK